MRRFLLGCGKDGSGVWGEVGGGLDGPGMDETGLAVTWDAGEYPCEGTELAAGQDADAGSGGPGTETGTAIAVSWQADPDAIPAPDLIAADTATASRLFKADSAPGTFAGRTVLLPFTTVAELAAWPERLLWGHARAEELCQWIDSRRMILGDETVARIWGRIVVAAQRAGWTPPMNDAWVAAGCLSYGLPLATLDPKSYQYFADRYGLVLI